MSSMAQVQKRTWESPSFSQTQLLQSQQHGNSTTGNASNQSATQASALDMLHVYIHDYCIKRNFHQAAKAFAMEAQLPQDAPTPIEAPEGFLYEWWSIFWDLFEARQGMGGSMEAKMFEDALAMRNNRERQMQQMRMAQLVSMQQNAQKGGLQPTKPGMMMGQAGQAANMMMQQSNIPNQQQTQQPPQVPMGQHPGGVAPSPSMSPAQLKRSGSIGAQQPPPASNAVPQMDTPQLMSQQMTAQQQQTPMPQGGQPGGPMMTPQHPGQMPPNMQGMPTQQLQLQMAMQACGLAGKAPQSLTQEEKASILPCRVRQQFMAQHMMQMRGPQQQPGQPMQPGMLPAGPGIQGSNQMMLANMPMVNMNGLSVQQKVQQIQMQKQQQMAQAARNAMSPPNSNPNAMTPNANGANNNPNSAMGSPPPGKRQRNNSVGSFSPVTSNNQIPGAQQGQGTQAGPAGQPGQMPAAPTANALKQPQMMVDGSFGAFPNGTMPNLTPHQMQAFQRQNLIRNQQQMMMRQQGMMGPGGPMPPPMGMANAHGQPMMPANMPQDPQQYSRWMNQMNQQKLFRLQQQQQQQLQMGQMAGRPPAGMAGKAGEANAPGDKGQNQVAQSPSNNIKVLPVNSPQATQQQGNPQGNPASSPAPGPQPRQTPQQAKAQAKNKGASSPRKGASTTPATKNLSSLNPTNSEAESPKPVLASSATDTPVTHATPTTDSSPQAASHAQNPGAVTSLPVDGNNMDLGDGSVNGSITNGVNASSMGDLQLDELEKLMMGDGADFSEMFAGGDEDMTNLMNDAGALIGTDGIDLDAFGSNNFLASLGAGVIGDSQMSVPMNDLPLQPIAVLSEHDQKVNAVWFNVDGSLLASGGQDKKVVIWDVNEKAKHQRNFLATASYDKTMRIWDVGSAISSGASTVTCKHQLTCRAPVMAVDFQPGENSDKCCSLDAEGEVKVWNVNTGANEKTVKISSNTRSSFTPNPLRFHPRSKTLVACALSSTLTIFDINACKHNGLVSEIPSTKTLPTSHNKYISSIDWSLDGSYLVTQSEDLICVWETTHWRLIATQSSSSKIASCSFIAGSVPRIAYGEYQNINVWQFGSMGGAAPPKQALDAQNAMVIALATHTKSDGSGQIILASGSSNKDSNVKLWSVPLPPMGFNPWARFECNVNQTLFTDTIDAMASRGLVKAGYEYFNIDDCWPIHERAANGSLQWNPALFPAGLIWLGQYIKDHGMKFGIYSDAGNLTCGGYPGSLGHEELDAQTFASWGQTDEERYQQIYGHWHDVLRKMEQPLVFSESAPAYFSGTKNNTDWYKVMDWVPYYGQLARHSNDIEVYYTYGNNDGGVTKWDSVMINYGYEVLLARYQRPGYVNDPDFITAGDWNLTLTEKKSHFALWASFSAPLIISGYVPDLSQDEIDYLTNKDLIALDQDPLVSQATLISQDPVFDLLSKNLANGDRALTVLNKGTTSASITVPMSKLGFTGSGCSFSAKDLWTGNTTKVTDSIGINNLESHSTAVYRVTPSANCKNVSATGQIFNTQTLKCLQSGKKATFGTCDASDKQIFQIHADKTVRLLSSPQTCLGVSGSNMVAQRCSTSTSQQWSYEWSGNLVNAASKLCLTQDKTGKATLTTCGDEAISQVFALPQ
ncbi:hypothetical protein BZG36_03367 [Bifiguratus adelaidae]|uniref:Alpha-galactosidase n=1 Tax=Bifiguratus adelaidae TaxID=1938954 RepID=A0A261XXQ0_9FUNG|nr:hypothetical protein BZG36_03367 [Bifiguratus adelaidae]